MDVSRRAICRGLLGAIAAPSVIRTPGLLMPVRAWTPEPRSFRLNNVKLFVYRPGRNVWDELAAPGVFELTLPAEVEPPSLVATAA